MEILDSGNRRQFESGAVRDIVEGKGRCDLMPLKMISRILEVHSTKPQLQKQAPNRGNPTGEVMVSSILDDIDKFMHDADIAHLNRTVCTFIDDVLCEDVWSTLLRLSRHYEGGAMKYGERNWEKGIALHSYIDSGVRHLLKYSRGDNDEPHDIAFIWNMLGAMWTVTNRPECIDLPLDNPLQ